MVRGIANSKIGFGDLILLLRYFLSEKCQHTLVINSQQFVPQKGFLLNLSRDIDQLRPGT